MDLKAKKVRSENDEDPFYSSSFFKKDFVIF